MIPFPFRLRRRMMVRTLAFVFGLALALIPLVLGPSSSAAQSDLDVNIYLPGSLNRGEFDGNSGEMTPGTPTDPPQETVVPTETGGATSTRTPEPTETATPRPTTEGGQVGHPSGQEIILQIGYTETDEAGAVWEEMNGTPWFTLYGDGTVIVGHELPNREQPLFIAEVDDEQIQTWLQELVYGAQFYQLPDDRSELIHPRAVKPVLHTYLRTTGGGEKLASIGGWLAWDRRGVSDHPYNTSIRRIMSLARDLEAWAIENATETYQPEQYTLIAQRQNPPRLDDPPPWEGLNVRPIAEAAPTAASNYVDRVPGHRFVDGELGREQEAYVIPEADRTWGIYNRAAEFKLGGQVFAIGVRKEVPGGSLFLPDWRRAEWYRRDVGVFETPGLLELVGDPQRLRLLGERPARHELGTGPPPVWLLPGRH